jgi:hypothetical protein
MQQQDTNPISQSNEKRRVESVKMLSLLGALGSWLIVATSAYLQLNNPDYVILTTISALMAICLTIANFSVHRNRLNLAVWLFIISTEIIFITISFAIANLGIILAIVLLIIICNITIQVFSPRRAPIAITTGIIASLLTLFADSFNPAQVILQDWQLIVIIIISGITILITGMELLTYYQFNSMRSQMITTFEII